MTDIETVLDNADRALEDGRGLAGTGFWPAVAQLRANGVLAVRYGDRVAAIDRRAFERGVRMRVAIGTGIAILVAGTVAGIAGLVLASKLENVPQAVVILASFGLLLLSTHSLAHFVVGRAVGIRFTHVFVAGRPPEPGVKTDYASYLRTTPAKRALMHASGAVVSKIVPFALVPVVFAMHAWPGDAWILLGVGAVTIATDIFISTRISDWKKVRRELRAARQTR
jgi:hypothetical protein